jgi:hypothetical protein
MGGWPRHLAFFSPQVQEIRTAIFWVIKYIVPTIQILCRGLFLAEIKGDMCSRYYCNLPHGASDIFVHFAMIVPPYLR